MDPEIAAVRALIERAATGDGPDVQRLRALRDIRDDLIDLTGQVETVLSEGELSREGQALDRSRDLLAARARADMRDELLRGNRLDAAALDELGYYSHARLDELADDGVLEAELERLPHPIEAEALT